MRIVPYDGNRTIEEIEALTIIIKCVPFENGFAPAFVLTSPSEDYEITIDELASLMDGIEIAGAHVDNMIDFLVRQNMDRGSIVFDQDLDDDDDIG